MKKRGKKVILVVLICMALIVAIFVVLSLLDIKPFSSISESAPNMISQLLSPAGITCTDTDGGKIYSMLGSCKSGSTTQTDYCVTNKVIMEYYCSGTSCIGSGYNCASEEGKVCSNGTCIVSCTPESNSAFCSRLGKNCGTVAANDNCGVSRTVNCGTCNTNNETCTSNKCVRHCRASDAAGCSGVGFACYKNLSINCNLNNSNGCYYYLSSTNCTSQGKICLNGTCIGSCTPETNASFCSKLGKNCGNVTANDKCNVSRTVSCGTCTAGYICSNGNCVSSGGGCNPNCTGKVCGDNGCGGSCGTCQSGYNCQSGSCVASCIPKTSCNAGECGSWNNGTCSGSLNCPVCGIGYTCSSSSNGNCVPDSNCYTSNGSFQNWPITPYTGIMNISYDATPNNNLMDGLVMFANSNVTWYDGYAISIRFNQTGYIDAYDNGTGLYHANAIMPYTAGTSYHFRILINLSSQTYNGYVTPAGQSEVLLINNHKIKGPPTQLNTLSMIADYGGTTSHKVCNLQINGTNLSAVCGNGKIEGSEQCDGTNITQTCQSLGFSSGTLGCYANCTFNTGNCVASSGNTYYVEAANGNDANPGTSALPWKTITYASTHVNAGDTVKIRNGTYGDLTLDSNTHTGTSWSSPITYTADAGHKPVISVTGDASAITIGSDGIDRNWYTIFDGLTLSIGAGYSAYGVLHEFGSHIIIQNCSMTGVLTTGGGNDSAGGIMLGLYNTVPYNDIAIRNCSITKTGTAIFVTNYAGNGIVISNNNLYGNSASGVALRTNNNNGQIVVYGNHIHDSVPYLFPPPQDGTHDSGIEIRNGNILVSGNIIHKQGTSYGIGTYGADCPGGFANLTIENNLVYDLYNLDNGVAITDMISNCVIRNNTFIGGHLSSYSGTSYYGASLHLSYRSGYDYTTNGKAIVTNNICVGGIYLDSNPVSSFTFSKNIIYSLRQSDNSWLGSFANNVIVTSSATNSTYFGSSFFIGGSAFDSYSYTRGVDTNHSWYQYGWPHGVNLNDAYHPVMTSAACNGSINPVGVAVGDLGCVCTNNSQCVQVFGSGTCNIATGRCSTQIPSLSPFARFWEWLKSLFG